LEIIVRRRSRRRRMKATLAVLGYVCCVVGIVLSTGSEHHASFEELNLKEMEEIEKEREGLLSLVENDAAASPKLSLPKPLMVPLTLIQGAASKGAGISLSLSLPICFCDCTV
jgi:hypothetical protein